MRRLLNLFVWIFLSVISLNQVVAADELILDNGDRITGQLVHVAEGELVIKTDYAGEITVRIEKLSRLKTDKPMETTLIDGTRRMGTVFFKNASMDDKKLGIERYAEEIDIAEVKSIDSKPKPRIRIKGQANVGVTNERGNTDTDQYRLDAELTARTIKHQFTIGGEFNKEKAHRMTTVSNWKGYGKYDYYVNPKWFLYASSLFENDKFADLDLRTTLGVGGGHQFFESEELNLSTSAGLAYVNEDFIVAEEEAFPGAQWIVRYDQFFFNKLVQLFHTNNGYISLDNSSNWLINTRQGLRFPLYKGFIATLQYNLEYNNEPSPDASEKWDSSTLFLLGYQFDN